MDEFLIILGLFAILGFIVFALIRSALVGSFFYKTGFRKTGLPKEKYAEYVLSLIHISEPTRRS